MLRILTERFFAIRSSSQGRRLALSFENLETRNLLSTAAVISWKMAPQITLNPAHGNAPDLPNTSAYVSPAGGYQVLLDASKTQGTRANSTFTWTISASGQAVASVQGKKAAVALPEGPYSVQLTVNGVKGAAGARGCRAGHRGQGCPYRFDRRFLCFGGRQSERQRTLFPQAAAMGLFARPGHESPKCQGSSLDPGRPGPIRPGTPEEQSTPGRHVRLGGRLRGGRSTRGCSHRCPAMSIRTTRYPARSRKFARSSARIPSTS